jgi:RNA polymerase sigma-70 factor (ECF subfamily)
MSEQRSDRMTQSPDGGSSPIGDGVTPAKVSAVAAATPHRGRCGRPPLGGTSVNSMTTGASLQADPATPAVDAHSADALLERVYRAEFRRLVGLGRLLTGSASAGEDLAHDVFVDALKRIRRDPGYLREPAWPWLRAALVNFAAMRRRQAVRELLRLARVWRPPLDEQWSVETLDFMRALATLPPRMRACVVLHYCEDLPVLEVATELACSPRTVEGQLRTARTRLAAALQLEAPTSRDFAPPLPGDTR